MINCKLNKKSCPGNTYRNKMNMADNFFKLTHVFLDEYYWLNEIDLASILFLFFIFVDVTSEKHCWRKQMRIGILLQLCQSSNSFEFYSKRHTVMSPRIFLVINKLKSQLGLSSILPKAKLEKPVAYKMNCHLSIPKLIFNCLFVWTPEIFIPQGKATR